LQHRRSAQGLALAGCVCASATHGKKASSSAPLSNRYEHQIPFFPHATTQRPLLALPLVISTHTEYFFTTPTLHQHFSSRIVRNEFKTQLVRLQDKAARTCPPLKYRARIGRTPLLLPFALPYSIYPSTTATTYHHPKLMPKKRRILMTYEKPLRSPLGCLRTPRQPSSILDTYTHAPSSPASLRSPSLSLLARTLTLLLTPFPSQRRTKVPPPPLRDPRSPSVLLGSHLHLGYTSPQCNIIRTPTYYSIN
jgi:hypothetical protein